MKLALEVKEIINKISEGRSTKGYKAVVTCSPENADILKVSVHNLNLENFNDKHICTIQNYSTFRENRLYYDFSRNV